MKVVSVGVGVDAVKYYQFAGDAQAKMERDGMGERVDGGFGLVLIRKEEQSRRASSGDKRRVG